MQPVPVVDSHVHFWDPGTLHYPWLANVPALNRAALPREYSEGPVAVPVEGMVVVEANPRPDQNVREVEFIRELADSEPRIWGIVAFVDLTDTRPIGPRLGELAGLPKVRGFRHNIQGNAPGFCLQPTYVAGVREIGRRGLTFDLCATHDQLPDVLELVRRAPDTRFVLDHCGKPAIRARLAEPWRADIARLAGCDNLWCKLSGLFAEADPAASSDDELLPFAAHVVQQFGCARVMYGSDWPVSTRAGQGSDWHRLTQHLASDWTGDETRRFYRDTALRFYGIRPTQLADLEHRA